MIIKYKNSPTGKAFISDKYKPPFTKNKTGKGFIGIKIQTDDRKLIECSICGEWFKNLSGHLQFKHGTTSKKYKERFSLLPRCGLVSDENGNQMKENLGDKVWTREKWTEGQKKIWRKKLFNNKKYKNRKKYNPNDNEQYRNRKGVCDAQNIADLYEYIWRFGCYPHLRGGRDGQKIYQRAYRRYGSFKEFLIRADLPLVINGWKKTYIFSDGEKIKLEDGQNFNDTILPIIEQKNNGYKLFLKNNKKE